MHSAIKYKYDQKIQQTKEKKDKRNKNIAIGVGIGVSALVAAGTIIAQLAKKK